MKFKRILFLLFTHIFLIQGLHSQSIRINELYFSNFDDNFPNYIELHNTSDSLYSLLGYRMIINNTSDSLTGAEYLIQPKGYALIIQGNIDNLPQQFINQLPQQVPVLTLVEKRFNLYRNNQNQLILKNEYNQSLDTLTTRLMNEPDHSYEFNPIANSWESSPLKYGTPGSNNSALLETIDLEINQLQVKGNQIFEIKGRNNGLKAATNATITLGHDKNLNGHINEGEEIAVEKISVKSNANFLKTIDHKIEQPGLYNLILSVDHSADQLPENNYKQVQLNIAYERGGILINEFMYAPHSDDPEWVEIFNNSDEVINLKYWQLADQGNSDVITRNDYRFSPGDYLVIADDSAYFQEFEEDLNFLYASDGLPSLNNTGDSIQVLDPGANTIDSLCYDDDWQGDKGISLEKIDPTAISNDPAMWGLSIHENGGTPGFENAIILKDFDLKIDGMISPTESIFPGDTIPVITQLLNYGREDADPFQLKFYLSLNDTLFEDTLLTKKFPGIDKGMTVLDTTNIPINHSGILYLKSVIDYEADEKSNNNTALLAIPVGFPNKTMVINEIMYNPETGKPEWFEVANLSDSTVNMQNWLFRDSQNTIHVASETPAMVPPDSFAVISEDGNFASYYDNFKGILLQSSSFPTLNNSGDSLILLDHVENYIDSLGFEAEWGNKQGVSLERKSTEQYSNSFLNWSLSEDDAGSTPGYTNSIALKDFDLAIDTLYLKHNNILHRETATLVLRILNNGERSIDDFDLSINVYQDERKETVISEKYITVNRLISAGYYTKYEIQLPDIPGGVHPVVAKVYATQDNILTNNRFENNIKIGYQSNSLIINEVMYSPHSGEAEWFELYNTANHEIDLNQWRFRDISDQPIKFCDTVRYIAPEDYAIVAAQEDFLESFPNVASPVIIPTEFPTLNNTSDGIAIFDAVAHRSDSIYYMQSWGGEKGITIERRNPFVPALARDNWGTCEDSLGGTPGERNTILKYDYDLTAVVDGFQFRTPKTTPDTENYFTVLVKNSGIYESGLFTIKIYHDQNFDNYPEEEEMVWSLRNIPSIAPDSTRKIEGKIFSGQAGRSHYIAKVITNSEENIVDNQTMAILKVAFEESALVLNEFLAAPDAGQTEFLECVNNSDQDVLLQGWQLSNEWNAATIDFNTTIPAGNYVIFCQDSSIFDYYPPTQTPIFVLDDWQGMNNTQDFIVLKDLTGKTIDSLHYTTNWPGEYGRSLEKIMPAYASHDSASWQLSEAELGATPGEFNSISPYVYDLKISDMYLSKTKGNSETLFDIKFYLDNIGREQSESAKLQLYDMKFNAKSLYRTLTLKPIEANTRDSITMQLSNLDKGYHNFLAQIAWSKDQNQYNDTTTFVINISYDLNDLYISEFMAAPKGVKTRGASIAEYIEFYNPQNRSVHIDGWQVSDENTADQYLINSEKTIPAESYFVIATDSTIFNFADANSNNTVVLDKMPSLNNDEDKILIIDPTNIVIDSLVYTTEWDIEEGHSKEKIYMANENFLNNWRSATTPQGGTPGAVNSVVVAQRKKKTGLRSDPNPFTPNGDGHKDEIGFYYQLSYPSANIQIDIYDLTGRLIASPVENMRTNSEGVVYWDGTNKYGEKARVGMYIARITATDANSRKSEGHIATFTLMK